MALRFLPTYSDGRAHVYYTVQLDGILYYIYLDYNARDEHWYMNIHDAANLPIEGCVSKKLVVNWSILKGVTVDTAPQGKVITSSSGHVDPGLLDLGVTTALYYLDAA
jgi:hypothetical protein